MVLRYHERSAASVAKVIFSFIADKIDPFIISHLYKAGEAVYHSDPRLSGTVTNICGTSCCSSGSSHTSYSPAESCCPSCNPSNDGTWNTLPSSVMYSMEAAAFLSYLHPVHSVKVHQADASCFRVHTMEQKGESITMFTQIIAPSARVYDRETGQLLGKATFQLTNETEKKILDLVNQGVPLPSFTVLNLNFVPSASYVPPVAMQPYPRKGIFRALFKMCNSHTSVPVELYGTFVTQMRSNEFGTQGFVSSADFNDVHVDDIKQKSM